MMVIREVKKRPVRGGIWGLVFGLGLALLLIAYNVIALGTAMPYVVIALGVVLGGLWGWMGPAKEKEGELPPAVGSTTSDGAESSA